MTHPSTKPFKRDSVLVHPPAFAADTFIILFVVGLILLLQLILAFGIVCYVDARSERYWRRRRERGDVVVDGPTLVWADTMPPRPTLSTVSLVRAPPTRMTSHTRILEPRTELGVHRRDFVTRPTFMLHENVSMRVLRGSQDRVRAPAWRPQSDNRDSEEQDEHHVANSARAESPRGAQSDVGPRFPTYQALN